MLFQLGHGHCVVAHSNQEARPDGTTLAAVCGRNGNVKRGAPPTDFGAFGYYFRDAPEAFPGKNTTKALDALGDAMAEPPGAARPDSRIPVIFTYLGQFIDHDISAGTDRDAGLSMIDGDDIAPAPRELVMRDRLNLRAGALRLDSLYGDSPDQDPFSRKLASLLRDPDARAKMWLGSLVDAGRGRVPLPEDGNGDLLRLGRLLQEPHKQLDEAEIRALPEPLRPDFINRDGSVRTQRAVIGDARNDENLILAQLHLAFLRFHNRVVDAANSAGGPFREGDDAVYNWARQLVRWHYQWLVLNAYLPKVCDQSVVADVLSQGAPLYSKFYRDHVARAIDSLPPDRMPLPLEFSAAAFRFGHSMVRASYDWNRYFGRPVNSEGLRDTRADLEHLFAYTGNGARPMPAPEGGSLASRLAQPLGTGMGAPGGCPRRAARPGDAAHRHPIGSAAYRHVQCADRRWRPVPPSRPAQPAPWLPPQHTQRAGLHRRDPCSHRRDDRHSGCRRADVRPDRRGGARGRLRHANAAVVLRLEGS